MNWLFEPRGLHSIAQVDKKPLPLGGLHLVDEERNVIPADGESKDESVLRPPWLTQGYLKDQFNSKHLWRLWSRGGLCLRCSLIEAVYREEKRHIQPLMERRELMRGRAE